MTKFESIAVDGRVAVVLPEELRARLGVNPGEHIDPQALARGIDADAAEFERIMTVARRVMNEDAEALSILAR